jgi:hypothetical protein
MNNKKPKNTVFLGIRDSTYISERQLVRSLYVNENWVTSSEYDRTEIGHSSYIDNIFSHKFTFAPRGNGVDTHRIWESLYLRTIPIVRNMLHMSYFKNLPILFVDNWSDITQDFLEDKYLEMMEKEYDLEPLKLSYWIKKLSSIK